MALSLVIGGARSGKSRFAVDFACRREEEVVFIATAEARDEDMEARIARHRRERPAWWTTLEEPLALEAAIEQAPGGSCVIIDCLTLWVANLLATSGMTDVEERATAAARAAAARTGATLAVTNEVGMGIVPALDVAREYRDALGRVNAIWAAAAEHALLLVGGRVLELGRPDDFMDRIR